MSINDSRKTKDNPAETESERQLREYQEVIERVKEVGRRAREYKVSPERGLSGDSIVSVTGW